MLNALIHSAANKILLLVGDEGATVLYFRKGVLDSRFFLASPGGVNSDKLKNILKEDPSLIVQVFLDHADQVYDPKILPITSTFGVDGIALKRLGKTVPHSYLRSAQKVCKLSNANMRDWLVSNIYCAYESPVIDWIEFLLPYQVVIEGIYFMPLEVGAVASELNALFDNKGNEWLILISQTRVGGCRLSVYRGDKVILSRVINNLMLESSEVSAGNIEVEVNNTIEFLRRLTLDNALQFNLLLMIDDKVEKLLRAEQMHCERIKSLTVLQVSNLFGFENLVAENEKYLDQLLLSMLFKRTLISTLHTSETLRSYNLHKFTNYAVKIAMIASLSVLIMAGYLCIDIYDKVREISLYNKNISLVENELRTIKAKTEVLKSSVKNSIQLDRVSEIVDMYLFLTKNHVSPNQFISEIGPYIDDKKLLTSLQWSFNDPLLLLTSGSLIDSTNVRADRIFTLQSRMTFPIASTDTAQQRGKELEEYFSQKLPDYNFNVDSYEDNMAGAENKNEVVLKMTFSPLSKLNNLEVVKFRTNKGVRQ